VVNHTQMRCLVPPGVGSNHTWQVYVGGQGSMEVFDSSHKVWVSVNKLHVKLPSETPRRSTHIKTSLLNIST